MALQRPVILLSTHIQNTYFPPGHVELVDEERLVSDRLLAMGATVINCGSSEVHTKVTPATEFCAASFRLGEGFMHDPQADSLTCLNTYTSPLQNPHLLSKLSTYENPLLVITGAFISKCAGATVYLGAKLGYDCYLPLDLVTDGTFDCPHKFGSAKFLDHNMAVALKIAENSNPHKIMLGSSSHLFGVLGAPVTPTRKKPKNRARPAPKT